VFLCSRVPTTGQPGTDTTSCLRIVKSTKTTSRSWVRILMDPNTTDTKRPQVCVSKLREIEREHGSEAAFGIVNNLMGAFHNARVEIMKEGLKVEVEKVAKKMKK